MGKDGKKVIRGTEGWREKRREVVVKGNRGERGRSEGKGRRNAWEDEWVEMDGMGNGKGDDEWERNAGNLR